MAEPSPIPGDGGGGQGAASADAGRLAGKGERALAGAESPGLAGAPGAEVSLRAQLGVLAEEARRREEFLAMMRHELRNALAPIRSATYILKLQERAGKENPDQRAARETIERNVAHLAQLVNELADSRSAAPAPRVDPRSGGDHAE